MKSFYSLVVMTKKSLSGALNNGENSVLLRPSSLFTHYKSLTINSTWLPLANKVKLLTGVLKRIKMQSDLTAELKKFRKVIAQPEMNI
jgi:hypothetical protein